ncbi:MAG: hypothetical protein A3F83_05095 [Candidatus Glassbacteria bacterium RIFCSPLOWO2_12_FULL_58_11]|uniref:Uncharacterized protein n=2 Tax=Candidatus Glassiibacteriota TaxID=1817805 RepID=A0A1F5Z0Q5_9BACT|nr:MAG: hypothetical protein A2Z86_11505 [Candidatus Glassbacteria bacterium GWA2_58_10]OGG05945.1 MAG: hypothetical protein A3F83_05095 [Candidatus Glassbacteria bacterium RIFCSPLOWO2_12_FULL_58_11]
MSARRAAGNIFLAQVVRRAAPDCRKISCGRLEKSRCGQMAGHFPRQQDADNGISGESFL